MCKKEHDMYVGWGQGKASKYIPWWLVVTSSTHTQRCIYMYIYVYICIYMYIYVLHIYVAIHGLASKASMPAVHMLPHLISEPSLGHAWCSHCLLKPLWQHVPSRAIAHAARSNDQSWSCNVKQVAAQSSQCTPDSSHATLSAPTCHFSKHDGASCCLVEQECKSSPGQCSHPSGAPAWVSAAES